MMHTRFLVAHSVLAISVLVAADALAQSVLAQNPPAAAPPAVASLPDACKLMPQSDLEALFPGRPITSKGPTLSAIYKGPQYAEGCQYAIQLPSPTSKLETTKFAMLTIIRCGVCSKDREGAAETFASIRDAKTKVSADPKLNMRVEPLSGVGDDAFQVISNYDVDTFARKDDLIFLLSLGKYSPQTQPNAVALAGQVAKRWRGGVGMIEAAAPIASNSGVDVPADTRVSLTAPPDQWPDACALLKPEDVRVVFGDMKVDPPSKTMGQITYYSRVDRVENLPNPIRCSYEARKTDLVNGQRQTTANSIVMIVSNVATTVDSSRNHYASSQKVGDADTPVAGLGDEASISIMNQIYIRKGVLNVSVRVGGGERDQTLHADARRRVIELAKLVAAQLP
jgi:hypothetical protein